MGWGEQLQLDEAEGAGAGAEKTAELQSALGELRLQKEAAAEAAAALGVRQGEEVTTQGMLAALQEAANGPQAEQ